MKIQKKKSKGFTLLELLVVLAIMAILVAIAVPRYQAQRDKAAITAHQSNVRILETAGENYYQDNGSYPESIQELQTKGYIKEVPQIPKNKKKVTGSYTIDKNNGNVSPDKNALNE
ncbi:MAG: prepilin-type N-terminal cleavage/methylation domain-containing protein [Finegoldia sp.]|nr:prepilin-type N-terminal cleavage/methylation domain-containing protein [Finegoldia sp.]